HPMRFGVFRAVVCCCAWDSAFSARWTAPARGILYFPCGGLLLRAGFCNFRAMEPSHAWNPAVSERWSPPAHGIPRLLSGGTFLRVGKRLFWAMASFSCIVAQSYIVA